MQSLIICIDNSESTRNGDFGPSRLMQQREAVAELLRVQMRSNPENEIALMTTSGRRNSPEMLLPLCREQVAFQRKLYAAESQGTGDPITSLRIAQLALKHRRNRQANQRVVLFLGSPLSEDKKDNKTKDEEQKTSARQLKRLGLALRKANISLDLVVFGEPEEVAKSAQTLQPLVTALGPSMCQLVAVTSDQVISEQVLQRLSWLSETVQRAGPAVLAEDGEGQDAELMLAIQMSLQEANAAKKEKEAGKGSSQTTPSPAEKSNAKGKDNSSSNSGKVSRQKVEKMPSAQKVSFLPGKVTVRVGKEGKGAPRVPSKQRPSGTSSSSSVSSPSASAAEDEHDLGDQLLLAVMALEEAAAGQKREVAAAKQSNAASRIPVAIKTGFSLTATPTSSSSSRNQSSRIKGNSKRNSKNNSKIPVVVLFKHKVADSKSKNTAAAAAGPKATPRYQKANSASKGSLPILPPTYHSSGKSKTPIGSIVARSRESSGGGGGGKSGKQKTTSFIGFYKSGEEKEKEKSVSSLPNATIDAGGPPGLQKSSSSTSGKSNISVASSSENVLVHSKQQQQQQQVKKKKDALLVNTKKMQEMINAKLHSLEAAGASKVVGCPEGEPAKSYSEAAKSQDGPSSALQKTTAAADKVEGGTGGSAGKVDKQQQAEEKQPAGASK